jgi:hypothetical protein
VQVRKSALGVCVRQGKRPLTTVHAKLEAMVLRARRGTHQGVRNSAAGDARARGRVIAECSSGSLVAVCAGGEGVGQLRARVMRGRSGGSSSSSSSSGGGRRKWGAEGGGGSSEQVGGRRNVRG